MREQLLDGAPSRQETGNGASREPLTSLPPSATWSAEAFSPMPVLAAWRVSSSAGRAEAVPGTDEPQPTEERFMYLLRRTLSKKAENKLSDKETKVCDAAPLPWR